MKDIEKKYKSMQTAAGESFQCIDAAGNSIIQEPVVQEDQPSNPGRSAPGTASKSAASKKQGTPAPVSRLSQLTQDVCHQQVER